MHSATLTWVASPDIATPPVAGSGYNVYRGTNPPGNEGATPINSSLITALTYVDNFTGITVSAGEKLDYVVTAVITGVESVYSNEVTVTIPVAPPSGLSATVA